MAESPNYSDHDMLLTLHTKMDGALETLGSHEKALWKGTNGHPAVMPSILTLLRWLKIIGGIAIVVATNAVWQSIQQNWFLDNQENLSDQQQILIKIQEDIRRITLETAQQAGAAAYSAKEASDTSTESQEILEKKVLPEVRKVIPEVKRQGAANRPSANPAAPSRPSSVRKTKPSSGWWPGGR